jgi:uncharacterized protein (DUF1015 family)
VRQSLGAKKTAAADYFLTTLFPSNQLEILDYNRVIKTLNGLSEATFLQLLQQDFIVEEKLQLTNLHNHIHSVYISIRNGISLLPGKALMAMIPLACWM